MKKFLLTLFFTLLFAALVCEAPVFAVCNYVPFCPPKAYGLSTKFGQTLSRRSGATFLSEKIAQARIQKELKKVTKQKLKVTVKTYSMLDMLRGRFKSIIISGKNLNINGVYISSLELKSLCDFNYVQFDRNPIRFKENMIIGFSTVMTDSDLTKTMNSSGYFDKLNCVDVHGCGITFFKLSGAGVNIKNNKLYFKVKVTSQLLLPKPLDIAIATDLKAENGRIVLTKVDLGDMAKGVDLSNVAVQLSKMNPLIFSLEVLENKNTKLCIREVKIDENKIAVSGYIFIPKTVSNRL